MYLWVNLADLSSIGTIGPLGSPLKMMILPEKGDELLSVSVFDHNRVDDIFVLVSCTLERATAISEAMELIAQRKLGRKIRLRTSEKMPETGKKWRVVYS